jgi:hypothetical protein
MLRRLIKKYVWRKGTGYPCCYEIHREIEGQNIKRAYKRAWVTVYKMGILISGFFGGLGVSIYSKINKAATKFYEGKIAQDEKGNRTGHI